MRQDGLKIFRPDLSNEGMARAWHVLLLKFTKLPAWDPVSCRAFPKIGMATGPGISANSRTNRIRCLYNKKIIKIKMIIIKTDMVTRRIGNFRNDDQNKESENCSTRNFSNSFACVFKNYVDSRYGVCIYILMLTNTRYTMVYRVLVDSCRRLVFNLPTPPFLRKQSSYNNTRADIGL